MRVSVNGSEIELPDRATVRDAATAIDVDPEGRGVAVAVDGEVVPRSKLETTELSGGERIEIVAAIQGGGR
jgi:sulfur carrier protein